MVCSLSLMVLKQKVHICLSVTLHNFLHITQTKWTSWVFQFCTNSEAQNHLFCHGLKRCNFRQDFRLSYMHWGLEDVHLCLGYMYKFLKCAVFVKWSFLMANRSNYKCKVAILYKWVMIKFLKGVHTIFLTNWLFHTMENVLWIFAYHLRHLY